MTQGACLCGTVRYEIDGPFGLMMHCHCSMCRKHHGASFATFVSAPLMGFRWLSGADNIGKFSSSAQSERCFCKTCGSVAPALVQSMDLAICPAGNLVEDIDARPQSHFFVASKAPWYEITDDLPQYAEYPPEFSAGSVARPTIEPREGITEGSCLCGKVAFELTGAPIRMMNCHCTRCRRGRSCAHVTNVFYKTDDFRFTRGEEAVVGYRVPDAQFFATAFCGDCGSMTARVSKERGTVVVPAGALDTDPQVRPMAHIYVGSKANWFEITDGLPRYEAGMS